MARLKVLLTGGSTGIGHDVVRRFLPRDNYELHVIGLNKPDVLPSENFTTCDLSALGEVEILCASACIPFDHIDVLINNAGTSFFAHTHAISLERWSTVLSTNLTACFALTSRVLKGMYERNFGTVISISSDADAQGFSTGAAYAASKFGLRGFIESLRCEARGTNVKICLISPARVDTNFNGKKPGDRPQSLTPSDVVDAIDYVLGTSARCVPSIIRLNSTLE